MASDHAGQLKHRLGQGLHALYPWGETPATPDALADERLITLFESLSARDRRHVLTAWRAAQRQTEDTDLLLAVLLHDIGKVTLAGTQISLAARVFAVLGQTLPAWMKDRLRPSPGGAWLVGPWLAEHHGRLGADRLSALGVSEETCRLVEQHGDYSVTDERLRMLREIDSSTH